MMNTTVAIALSILLFCFNIGCRNEQPANHLFSAAERQRIIQEIIQHRSEADTFFRSDPESPFQKDTSAHFTGIKWFPPDIKYYCQSTLHRYERSETVSVFGTKGEERKHLKYGYFMLTFEGQEYKLNVYKYVPGQQERSPDLLSVWFTDATTGKETYEVGRYVDVGNENVDPDFVYMINFNNAYNPYCAYSAIYSCAIPRREDHLDIPIRAGELKYHQ